MNDENCSPSEKEARLSEVFQNNSLIADGVEVEDEEKNEERRALLGQTQPSKYTDDASDKQTKEKGGDALFVCLFV